MKKVMSYLSKFLLVTVFILTGILLAGNIGVKADAEAGTEAQVRVSTVKQLKKAINDPEIMYIIFRTREMDSFTIKENKNAKDKLIVIDAPNATITNKAKFAGIEIQSVMNYTENVSGNNIYLSDPTMVHSFSVAKNKTLESLGLVSMDVCSEIFNCYYLKKGAKINNVSLIYIGTEEMIYSDHDESKNELTINYTDINDQERSYTVKLDKSGRITRMTSNATFKFDYKYKYNKNGYWTKLTGSDDEDGKISFVKEYKGDYILKDTFKSEVKQYEYVYKYEKDAFYQSPYEVTYNYTSEDYEESWVRKYTYDKKNRMITMYTEFADYILDVKYSYNSKDFADVDVYTYYTLDGEQDGDSLILKTEYNKAGDLIRNTRTQGENVSVEEYAYNEFGELIDTQYS